MDMPPQYNPKETEDRWYKYWMDKGYFRADSKSGKEPFCMVIPPPNITGSLHMGHALNNTLQDILTRWKRMSGFSALWLPGTDHAGIATQNVIERELKKEGLTRQQVGREDFIKRVWKWRDSTGGTIINQLKKLGCSCDWSRTRFTMDEGLSKAVQQVFITLYNEGLIYRDTYIINWCPRCQTALSDLEAEHQEVAGHLYYVKYELIGNDIRVKVATHDAQLARQSCWAGRTTHDCITVATTRPETIFGDVAIAVNPKDKRYKNFIGKKVRVPELCGGREIPVIADDYVDIKFGTGCLKITPAHDPADFEIGRRHKLEAINVISADGKMNGEAGKYAGLDRFECRKALVEDLKNQGRLEKTEDYKYTMGSCYRCHTYVEPYLSKQWFVRMKELAKPAIKAVKDGKVRFVPKSWGKTYYLWMDNIRDWCISRQIWWGHRIPVWYCKNEKCPPVVSTSRPAKCPECGGAEFSQDEDVLDTWFSSALWPFSTLGWPDKTDDLRFFYPTTVLSTAFDIIFFWVARMIIMGMHFMKDVPFRTVYIHALVRDPEGQKMSKSRGNVVDPLGIMDVYGTDALRFTMSSLAVKGRDIYLSEERIQGYRNFMNKIWNASRFILMNLANSSTAQLSNSSIVKELSSNSTHDPLGRRTTHDELTVADRWIMSRLNQVTKEVTGHLEKYDFDKASLALYDFFWHEFCDWYLEIAKLQLSVTSGQWPADSKLQTADNEKTAHYSLLTTQYCLFRTLEQSLRLMHPFVPFITEEIWQTLKTVDSGQWSVDSESNNSMHESIMVSKWPEYNKKETDAKATAQMELVKAIVFAVRNIRSELNIHPGAKIKAIFSYTAKKPLKAIDILNSNAAYIKWLAGIEEMSVGEDLTKPRPAAVAVVKGIEIYIPLEGLIDIQKETDRIKKEIEKAGNDLKGLKARLRNKEFLKKAPEEVVTKEKDRKIETEARLGKLKENLKMLA